MGRDGVPRSREQIQLQSMDQRRGELTDSMTDRVLYTLAVGLAGGAASLLAIRLVDAAWRRARGTPPKALGIVRSVGWKAGEKAVRPFA